MTRKHRTPFVFQVGEDGVERHYVDAVAIGGWHIAAFDGLPITKFDGDDRVFITLDDAAVWHQRENSNDNVMQSARKVIERLKAAVDGGKFTDINGNKSRLYEVAPN